MTSEPIITRACVLPAADRREILRYAGVRGSAPEVEALLEQCLRETEGQLSCKVCFRSFAIQERNGMLDLGFAVTDSTALQKHLYGCSRIVVFAATVGQGIDRLIARYAAVSPTKALLFQAIGAERIECLCDLVSREIAGTQALAGNSVRARFSPGYGDFPLEMQRAIFAVLDCPRQIGLTLNESLLMSPTKSVTAVIGIKKEENRSQV